MMEKSQEENGIFIRISKLMKLFMIILIFYKSFLMIKKLNIKVLLMMNLDLKKMITALRKKMKRKES
jgi:hypothetical protein